MSLVLHYFLLSLSFFTYIATAHSSRRVQCTSKCGSLEVPFPFYLTATSCGPSYSDAFHLSCINSSALFLSIASESYRVLQFLPDGVLVDFPNASTCRQYSDLKSFAFSGGGYYGISTDNVLELADCEDSSLCKSDCENISVMPGCDSREGGNASCCYPLSDHSAWGPGESLSEFSRFGCRGFFSWLVLPGTSVGKRGIKLEWAIPENLTAAACAANADVVNATAVTSGIRCQCRDGFVGNGFNLGSGCLKSCSKDGKEVRGDDCYRDNHGKKKAIILVVVITSALAAASFTAVCLLKWPIRSSDQSHTILSSRTCRSQLFSYRELEEATGGFDDARKIVDGGARTTLYAGVLTGGSHVAVHRIQCVPERDLIRVLLKLEALSAVSHRNLARIVGWSVDSTYTSANTPFVVYDLPENGTLEEHLLGRARDEKIPQLDWYKRLHIAAETASLLAYLHHEVTPPIFHNDLHSGYIFLDTDFSVKLVGFQLLNSEMSESSNYEEGLQFRENDVCSLGVVLLEIITGSSSRSVVNFSTMALQKIKNGQLEEIVDPGLYYHVQSQFQREQIDKIAELATRCLLFGPDGKLGMAEVAQELTHVARDNIEGSSQSALEETFSNSSLLQMISMSPDSIYVP